MNNKDLVPVTVYLPKKTTVIVTYVDGPKEMPLQEFLMTVGAFNKCDLVTAEAVTFARELPKSEVSLKYKAETFFSRKYQNKVFVSVP